ncbi:hypothetical protein SKAU_G00319860 [Synaphobranchus kaupii]|uniref:Uncharacterized protein n=1 Tax=Synaphobranchus kaupii TaxID=118154 RepID=A0A9Q1IHI2_SYNKA|nr:hypothetical protein SKAU_G00319860 [Synaphobranchus kaupii]
MSSTDAMKTPGGGAHVRREESETNPFAKHMWMENEEEYKEDRRRQEEEERLGEEVVASFFEELLGLEDQPRTNPQLQQQAEWAVSQRWKRPGHRVQE